jgi:EAL domain-containing protein (putative c-di-GMP-specific phosphodiesterase class I)/FixJ family two-component response regulator
MILDDDADFRKLLLTILGKKFEGVKITEHDPVADGVPGENFDWSRIDVLLIDYHLSIPRTTGLDILLSNRKNKLFPVAIMLTGAGNEEIAVRAVKAGVFDYLRKEMLDKERLYSTIMEAYEKHQEERNKLNELTSQSHAFNKALFYQELEQQDKNNKNRVLLLIELDTPEKIERKLGIIFRDNVIRHIAKHSFEVFKLGNLNPSITRFGDTSVAILFDEPTPRSVLEFTLEGLCAHLEKHPYMYNDRKLDATVSIGALCLSDQKVNAEDYIAHALNAVKKAYPEERNSFYLYNESDWSATGILSENRRGPEMDAETAPDRDIKPGATAVSAPVITAAPESRKEPHVAVKSGPAAGPGITAAATIKPVPPAAPAAEAIPPTEIKKPDPKELNEIMQKIKSAFDEKRAVLTFQQLISLTHEENNQEMYQVAVQLVNKDGSIMAAEELSRAGMVAMFRKFVDRWMLQEIIGRIIGRTNNKYTFLVNVSADSIADATFFNWLRKLLKGLDKNNPGEQIILNISAKDTASIQKQAGALTAFFKKTHGFRFLLSNITADQDVLGLAKSLQINFVSSGYDTLNTLNSMHPVKSAEAGNPSLMQLLKNEGIQIVADDVVDATRLTDTIALGADYATGLFIGEPVNQLDDVTNVESFEII